jgi:hypothetical protein
LDADRREQVCELAVEVSEQLSSFQLAQLSSFLSNRPQTEELEEKMVRLKETNLRLEEGSSEATTVKALQVSPALEEEFD